MDGNNTIKCPKKLHHNRFSYLLQPNQYQPLPQATKQLTTFNLDLCLLQPCKNQQVQYELVQQTNKQPKRKPPKLELQSMNFDLFKQKIDQKSSMNSFLAYTPSKDSEKQYFTLNNQDISTIEYSRANEVQTQRNQIGPIFDSYDSKHHSSDVKLTRKQPGQFSPITHSLQQDKSMNQQLNEFIRLELSQSDESDLQFQFSAPKKHNRTMTEQFQTWGKKQLNLSTAEKSVKLMTNQSGELNIQWNHDFNRKPNSIQANFLQQKTVMKKPSTQTIATVKTKQMSNKLQQSSALEFQNSVSLTSTNSQFSSQQNIHKSIRLKGKVTKKS